MIFTRGKIFSYFLLSYFLFINIENVFALQIKNVNFNASNNNDRWIEVFNDGANISDFTISDYKVLDSKDATKHSIVTLQGDTTFPANTSIFISPSTNIPSGAVKVFRSNYTLDKTNGYISIINSDNSSTYSCFAYGNVSCSQSGFIDNSTSTNSTSTNSTSTNSVNSSLTNIVYIYLPSNNQSRYGDISILLPEEKLLPAGADYEFDVKAIDKDKKAISGLNFEWSFGDGGGKFGQKVSHHYVYPGEYTLVASADGYTVGGEAKMNVKVIIPDISISKVGLGGKENFIDLTNNTDYDLVLSNFYLNLDDKFFMLPKNFTIAKKKSVHVSGEAVGFNLPAVNVSLNYPNKNTLVSYINTIISNAEISSSTVILKPEITKEQSIKYIKENIYKEEDNKIYVNKEIARKSDKEINKPLVLKRLILNNSINENITDKEIPFNLNKTKNVDTRIINWFKNLIY